MNTRCRVSSVMRRRWMPGRIAEEIVPMTVPVAPKLVDKETGETELVEDGTVDKR